jgi:hypothetical protein
MPRISEKCEPKKPKQINEMGVVNRTLVTWSRVWGRALRIGSLGSKWGEAAVKPAVNWATGRIRESQTDSLTGSSSADPGRLWLADAADDRELTYASNRSQPTGEASRLARSGVMEMGRAFHFMSCGPGRPQTPHCGEGEIAGNAVANRSPQNPNPVTTF